jgi:competence protein ComEA
VLLRHLASAVMPDTPRHVLALWAVGVVAVALLGVRYLGRGSEPRAPTAPPIQVGDSGGGGSSRVVVHVAGAVRRPGVYRLPARSRVVDAVHRAGGARPRADLSALNLAAKLEDGRQVTVPLRARAGAPAAAGSAATGAVATAPLDLNTATAQQLDEQLDGIGPGMAGAILEYREEHGGFGSVEELGQVPGIGEKRLAALREKVRV